MPIMKNFEITPENTIIVSVNPKIYALEVIYSAAYMFIDRFYTILNGDPEKEIDVELIPKSKNMIREELKKAAMEFNNELVNYSVYAVQAARTSGIRQAIIQAALSPVYKERNERNDKDINDEDTEEVEVELTCPYCGKKFKTYVDVYPDEHGIINVEARCPYCKKTFNEDVDIDEFRDDSDEDVDVEFVEDPLGIAKPWTPEKAPEDTPVLDNGDDDKK